MTGYGESSYKEAGIYIYVQIISLNSRSFDLQLDIPAELQSYAMKWREMLANQLKRGRVQLCIKLKHPLGAPLIKEKEAIFAYFYSLKNMAKELNTEIDLLGKAVDLAFYEKEEERGELSPEVVEMIQKQIEKALEVCFISRNGEGKRLAKHLNGCINKIKDYLEKVEAYLPIRKEMIRDRLIEQKKILDLDAIPDTTSWEKEINQYWDKVDVEEEVVRLKSHLAYLEETTTTQDRPVGKQLNFIIQEMARELNTIGAKAQDTTLQHFVVEMKEALEQVKEQVQNIL